MVLPSTKREAGRGGAGAGVGAASAGAAVAGSFHGVPGFASPSGEASHVDMVFAIIGLLNLSGAVHPSGGGPLRRHALVAGLLLSCGQLAINFVAPNPWSEPQPDMQSAYSFGAFIALLISALVYNLCKSADEEVRIVVNKGVPVYHKPPSLDPRSAVWATASRRRCGR